MRARSYHSRDKKVLKGNSSKYTLKILPYKSQFDIKTFKNFTILAQINY
jgi:hypothetical protein